MLLKSQVEMAATVSRLERQTGVSMRWGEARGGTRRTAQPGWESASHRSLQRGRTRSWGDGNPVPRLTTTLRPDKPKQPNHRHANNLLTTRLLSPRQPGCLETEHPGLMNQAPTSAKDPRLCAPPSPVVCLDGRCFSYSMLLQQVGGRLAEGTGRQHTGNARGVSSEKYRLQIQKN